MAIIPPEIPEIGTEPMPVVDAPAPEIKSNGLADMDARNYANMGRTVHIGGTTETSQDFTLHGQQDVNRPEEVEAPSLLELAGAQLEIDNPLVSAIQNESYDSYVHDPLYVPENDPVFTGLEDYYGDWAFAPSAEAAKAIAANLHREIDNRDIMSRASLGANLGVGLATELLNPTNWAMMFVPVAKGVSMASQAAKWGAIGVGQEAANELMLHQSQILRTGSESAQNLMFAGIMAGAIGGGVHWAGGRGSMAEAGRDLYQYLETGKIDGTPPSKLKDDPLADAIGVASRGDSAGAMRASETPNLNNVLSDYSLSPIGRKVRAILPDDYIPPKGPSKLKGNPITRTAESPLLIVRQNAVNMVDSPYYHQAFVEGRTIGNELGSIESRVGLHEAQYAEMKSDRQALYMDYRKANNSALNRVKSWGDDVTGQTAKRGMLTQIEFREQITKAVDNYGKHDNPQVAQAARQAIKYFDGVKKDLIEVGLLDDTFKTGDTSNYLHRMYNRDTLIKNEDEFVEILADHWQDMQAKYIAEAQTLTRQRDAAEGEAKAAQEAELDTPKAKEMQPKIDQAKKEIDDHEEELLLQQEQRVENKANIATEKTLTTDINKLDKQWDDLQKPLKPLETELRVLHRDSRHAQLKFEQATEGTKSYENWKVKAKERTAKTDNAVKAYDAKRSEISKESGPINSKSEALKKEREALDITPDETYRRRVEAERAAISKKKKFVREQESRLSKEAKGAKKKQKEAIAKSQKSQEKIQTKLEETLDFSGLSRADLIANARTTTQKIKGTPLGQTPSADVLPDIHVFKAGALKHRTLDIPRQKIEKFLENDIDLVQRSYQRATAPRIELARDYGDVDMKNMVEEISNQYQFLREDKLESMTAKGASKEAMEKMNQNIDAFKTRDIDDLLALRDKLLGTHMQPADPNGAWWRVGQSVRALQFMSMLGQMLISAIPDVARAVMVQGFTPTLRGLRGYMNKELRQMSKVELRKANVGWESVLNSRAYKMGDIVENQMYTTKAERMIGAATDNFAKATGMTMWNDALKSFSGAMIQDGMLRAVMSSNPTKRQIRELAKNGIELDGEMANTIRKLATKHGKIDGDLFSSGGVDWTKDLTGKALDDAMRAQTAFRSAILKSVNETIVTVGLGEMPLWMGHGVAKQVLQFKSFAISSHARALHSGLQVVDQQRVEALVMAMGLGALVYEGKAIINDKEVDRSNKGNYMLEIADRAGILGYLGEAHNYAGNFTGGKADVRNLWGGGNEQLSKYASRNTLENLAGPTAGTISNIQSVMSAVATGERTEQDVKSLRKLVPFQNLVWWNWALNRYNGVSDALINE